MDKPYSVRDFAALAGVTPRALRHYDRIGLLKPRRSAAGYRVYVERDLQRLEQIAALTFVGLPLRDVRRVLDGRTPSLADALRSQRAILEEKRRLLDRALVTVREAERLLASGRTPDAAVLKRLIEVIDMQRHVETLKRYFTDEAWTHLSRLQDQYATDSGNITDAWRALIREARDLVREDPASRKSQEFGERWIRLWEQTTGGDAAVIAGMRSAWLDRDAWPIEMGDLASELDAPEVGDFIRKVLASWMKRYYTDGAWARKADLDRPETNAAWTELYAEARALLAEDPASEKARDLAVRWCQLWKASTAGDPEIESGFRRAWMDRHRWPLPWQRHVDEIGAPAIAEWIGKAIQELNRKA